MNRLSKLVFGILVGIIVYDVGRAVASPSSSDQAMAICGWNGACSKYVMSVVNNLASPFANNTYVEFRNAANLADISALKVDATDDTVLNADTGDIIKLSIAGVAEVNISGDTITYTVAAAGSPSLLTSSVDATDSNSLVISSASAYGQTRGAGISLYGNEVASVGGGIDLLAGDDADATVDVVLENASSTFNVKDTTSGTVATITDAGALTVATTITATAGNITATAGDVVLSASGKTLALQEATAGAKCMGTLTANGTTAVTTSTTCVTAASRIFFSGTSDGSGSAANDQVGCWTTNIVAATSFDFDCSDANNNGTYNWIIFNEAA